MGWWHCGHSENVLACGTHTHSACSALAKPADQKPDEYQRFVIQRIADGVRCAVNNLRPAQVASGAAQAPEHVIENLRLGEKAKDGRKVVKRKPPEHNFANWDLQTFKRLMGAPPERLTSRFEVSHGMLLNVLARPGDGCRAMQALIDEFNKTNPYGITVTGRFAGSYAEIYNRIMQCIPAGTCPEIAVAYQNQAAMYANGAEYEGHPTYVLSGVHSTHAIGRPSAKPLQAGEMIQLNIGALVGGQVAVFEMWPRSGFGERRASTGSPKEGSFLEMC